MPPSCTTVCTSYRHAACRTTTGRGTSQNWGSQSPRCGIAGQGGGGGIDDGNDGDDRTSHARKTAHMWTLTAGTPKGENMPSGGCITPTAGKVQHVQSRLGKCERHVLGRFQKDRSESENWKEIAHRATHRRQSTPTACFMACETQPAKNSHLRSHLHAFTLHTLTAGAGQPALPLHRVRALLRPARHFLRPVHAPGLAHRATLPPLAPRHDAVPGDR
eukprot:361169-Chlamydomonas_euryale.AAC.2